MVWIQLIVSKYFEDGWDSPNSRAISREILNGFLSTAAIVALYERFQASAAV
jgi:hypothetical protein